VLNLLKLTLKSLAVIHRSMGSRTATGAWVVAVAGATGDDQSSTSIIITESLVVISYPPITTALIGSSPLFLIIAI
jgi:hypothetical protein